MLKVCSLRLLRLDDDGTLLSGASSQYVIDAPISLQYTPSQPKRERFEVIDGCGTQCALYIGSPKAVDSVDLEMHLCELDAEVTELLAGGTVITDYTYGTIGYLAPTDSTTNDNGVALETWAIQWNGRQRALVGSTPAWYRHVFPSTKWEVGAIKQENGFADIVMTGSSDINSGFGTGLASDPVPVTIGDAAYMWFVDDAKPSGVCGYTSVP
jgi:hypothetical protein